MCSKTDNRYGDQLARDAYAFEKVSAGLRASQAGPEAVAGVILGAVRADRPYARYPAAVPLLAQVAMQMPDAVKDRVVRRLYDLDSLRGPASVAAGHGHDGHKALPSEIAQGVWRLSVYGANVYFLHSAAGWVLVDAAWPWGNCPGIIRGAAESLFGPGVAPTSILLTHLHPDHDGAALELAYAWGCPLYIHANELPLARAVATGDLAGIDANGNELDRRLIVPLLRLMPGHGRAKDTRPTLVDVAQLLESAGVPDLPDWTWVASPGHTPGHVAFFRAADRVLLAGDAVLTVDASSAAGYVRWALGTRPPRAWAPPAFTNWSQARADMSLAALAALEPRVLASGHGTPLVNNAARELRTLAERTARRRRVAAGAG